MIEEFLRNHERRLKGVVARFISWDDPDFDDFVQEVFIEIWEVMAKKPEMPPAYLYGVARMKIKNVIGNHKVWTGQPTSTKVRDPLRRKDWAAILLPSGEDEREDVPTWDGGIKQMLQRLALQRASKALAPRQRELLGRMLAGATVAEAARDMAITPATGRQTFSRIKEILHDDTEFIQGVLNAAH